jgi:hypothetical protein
MRKKTSPIWQIPEEELQLIVKNSLTYTEVLKHFGFQMSNLNTLARRLNHDGINVSHFDQAKIRAKQLKKTVKERTISWEEVLVKDSPYKVGPSRKTRLVRENLLEYKCQINPCPMDVFNIGFTWAGKEVKLILDHKNGINTDNRLLNLRFVCSWCNSLLDTHAGRNIKKKVNRCLLCKTPIGKKAKHCSSCSKRKIEWPPIDALLKEVENTNLTKTAAKYKTSANNVKKRIRKFFPNWKSKYKPVPPRKG